MFFPQQFLNNDCEPSSDAICFQNEIKLTPAVLDNFTDTNNTSIASHTPNTVPGGSSWAQTNASSFYIQNNVLVANRYTDGDKAVIDSGLSDITFSADVTPFNSSNNSGYPGLVFRYSDSNNYWYVFPDSFNGWVRMFKVVAGVSTEVLHLNYATISGTSYNVRVDCRGKNIMLSINNVEIVTVSDNFNQTATQVGVRVGKGTSPATSPSWDNLTLYSFNGLILNWPDFTEQTTNSPIVALGSNPSWDDRDINNPNVVFDPVNNRYVLYYSATSLTAGGVQGMGLAYATAITGPWTKEAANPVYTDAVPINGDMNGGFIYFNGLWYNYYNENIGGTEKIKLATSPNLLTWTDKGVVLDVGSDPGWESFKLADPFVRIRQDGVTIELWYAGEQHDTIPNSRQFGFATSTDGLTFTKSPTNPIINYPAWSDAALVFGEPSVYVPLGRENQQMLLSFDTALNSAQGVRYISQALTLNNGKSWHYRKGALLKGTGWESAQVFDPFMIVVNNVIYLFHSGANTQGTGLGLNTEIGYATASFALNTLLGQ